MSVEASDGGAVAERRAPALEERSSAAIELRVEAISAAAEGVISILLAAADDGELPTWAPGAHVDLRLAGGIERSYSLCGDVRDARRWRLAVRREPESRGGSSWLHERLQVGDRLLAAPPRNHFPLEPADAYVLVAGGIGITPILPMVHELARRGAPFRLLYGGRTRASMAFLGELERYGERVLVRSEDEHGLLDLESWIGAPRAGVAVYCCGPEALLAAVEARCAVWPDGSLHVERFRPRPEARQGDDGPFEVVLHRSGASCIVAPHETILDALDRVGVHVPRSCGEGTCGTCLTAVVEGVPDHRDSFLMGKKRARNDTLCVCCSRSRTPRLVLDL